MFVETFFMFGFLVALLASVYFYFENRNAKEKLARDAKENARKVFELTLLSELSEKIGYSLSSKDIASTIALTAGKLFNVSAVTYGIVEAESIEITTIIHENVSTNYINGVKDIVLQAMYGIDEDLRKKPAAHKSTGMRIDNSNISTDTPVTLEEKPLSSFNIPLVLNNRFTGMVNITSKTANAYQEEDMSILYKIVNRAQLAVGRLEKVIEEEKGKIDALVKSLSSGEIFFTVQYDSLKLFTINPAALRYLDIKDEKPDIIHILSKFKLKPNLIGEMKEVILMKKCSFYHNVELGDSRLNIYMTPVFGFNNESVIGVALTMQDFTREFETQKLREGFTNMMVHELRAPLTAIKGASELLLLPTTDEDDKVKMRFVIKNASERLLHDIDDLLDSAKIDAGKLSIEKTEGNINEVILKTTEELSYAASSRSISIENHLDGHIPAFAFDKARIGQVMTNLLSNAIKYSKPSSVIEVFTRLRSDEVEIEVKDSGTGISDEKLELLFKPFSQVSSHSVKGTGLGLFISKGIVNQHNGRIWMESVVDKGTSAKFTLPLYQKTVEESTKASMLN